MANLKPQSDNRLWKRKFTSKRRPRKRQDSDAGSVRESAEKAGVGIDTFYRHFPQRSDLIAAVFHREIDACADAAPILADEHEPFEALKRWMQRYATFIAIKRGLATALHSGNPASEPLRSHFEKRAPRRGATLRSTWQLPIQR